MKKVIDTSGEACPKPVLMTKDALDENINELIVIVDNPAAKENVSRFATKQGHTVVGEKRVGTKFELSIKKVGHNINEDLDLEDYSCAIKPTIGKTIFLSKNKVGEGDDELGQNLMKAFIYSLIEVDVIPETIVFMNSAVKLCVEGAETLPNLLKLSEQGVEMLVCGTCLSFFGIADKLRVGTVSNMYDIASLLTTENILSI